MTCVLPGGGRSYEETKRFSRLIQIIWMIAGRPERYLRRDLADRFEVSERMIQKDIDVIRHGLKLPLQHTRRGYYFEEGPSLPPLSLTFPEAVALLLAMQSARRVSCLGGPALLSAMNRLESLLPDNFRQLLQTTSETPTANGRREHREVLLMAINQAVLERRKLKAVYETRSRDGKLSERVLRPYHARPYVRSWHLIAYCEKRCEVRTFKVDRFHHVELLNETYTIPEDFDLAEYDGHAWGAIRGNAGRPIDVVLKFDSFAGHWVSEEFWHPSQSSEILPDGGVIFRLRISTTPEFINWILYYGPRVEVLKPRGLRKEVAQAHLDAAGLYHPKPAERAEMTRRLQGKEEDQDAMEETYE